MKLLIKLSMRRNKKHCSYGPFGSGKSSVLQTLRKRYKEFEYLPISLATLQANEDSDNKAGLNIDDEQIELLNRKIEYSILQQLIYRKKRQQFLIQDLGVLFILMISD